MLSDVLDNDEILDQSGCARRGKESRSGGALSVEAVHGTVSSRIVHLLIQMHMLTRLSITNNHDPE